MKLNKNDTPFLIGILLTVKNSFGSIQNNNAIMFLEKENFIIVKVNANEYDWFYSGNIKLTTKGLWVLFRTNK